MTYSSRLTQKGQGAAFGLFTNDTDSSNFSLCGQHFDLADGREVVLVSVGGSGIVSGVLCQSSVQVANHQNLAVVANVAVGATSVTVTLGGTAITANQYAGGYLIVNAGAGIGQTLKIESHPAQANAAGNVILTLSDPVQVALTSAASKVCLLANPYTGVIINPTSATGIPVGVTLYPLTAGSYGYIVTKGIVSCLNAGGTAIGLGLAISGTAGALATVAATTGQVAIALQAGVTTESRAVRLCL